MGISAYAHESSCALLRDGEIVAMAEEERFNREKHTWRYPRYAMEFCLREARIAIADVDHFTFFWQPWRELFHNAAHIVRFLPGSLHLLAAKSGGGELSQGRRWLAMTQVGRDIQAQFGLSSRPRVEFIEHHLCHAASAFYVSGYDDAAILTVDGRGEATSTMLAMARGKSVTKLREIKVPHSLGHLYAAVTDYLGLRPFFDEWKTMGMSAYGTPAFAADFEPLIELTAQGYRLNLEYVDFPTHGSSRWVSRKFVERFGPPRKADETFMQRHFDIAFALQRQIEEAGVHLATKLYELTQVPKLCMTGGVVLNCLMNARIIEATPFEQVFIQPIANDAGTSLGSALYYYHGVLGQPAAFTFEHVYYGPAFGDDAIRGALDRRRLAYRRVEDIASAAAALIAQGQIVGWFQGRMECGPRALGNRSLLADPTDPTMKDRLNARVKHREAFRPFAPSVLEERVHDYFEMPKGHSSPYMILVGRVKASEKRLPAVTHADGTARVHTVSRRVNPRYWRLIDAFDRLKGVAVVLNTSFNENEPVVCTPDDAVACFLRTEVDALAIGDFLVTKPTGGSI
jgi:carbamoyltransferase